MIAVPPFRAELGILLRFHACAVRAMPRPVLVAHEPGLEALYPDCERLLVDSRPDAERRWTYRHDSAFTARWREELEGRGHEVVMPDKENRLPIAPWLPEPHEPQRGDAYVGVVVCPRMRVYGAEKNWHMWPQVVDALRKKGARVFVAGLQESSYPCTADEYAWDYARPLDATIEAMREAEVVLATASGLSLLAVLCSSPLVLVGSKNGKVAPGPARDLAGKVHHDRYWDIPIGDYYNPLNHGGSDIEVLAAGWQSPSLVLQRTLVRLPT